MKRVDPKVYTREYYLTDCTGHEEFKQSFGEKLEPRFKEIIKYLNITPDMKVLDVGCGRGEMVLFCAKRGAKAIGIDYAEEGILLAKQLLLKQDSVVKKRMQFRIMDAKELDFPDSFFDMCFLTDVVEHLYPEELEKMFGEIKRVLKPSGKVIIHTAPNKWFNDIGYTFYSYPLSTIFVFIWNTIFHRSYPNIASPKALRTDSHRIMHINEPTYFSLRKLFSRYHFDGDILSTNITARKPIIGLKDKIFNFFVFLDPLSRRFPLNVFWGSDFLSILINRK